MLGGFRNVEGVDLRLRGKDPVVTPVDQLGVPTYDELVLVAQARAPRGGPGGDPPLPRRAGARHAAAVKQPRGGDRSAAGGEPRPRPEADRGRGGGDPAAARARQRGSPTATWTPPQWREFIGWMRDNELIASQPAPSQVLSNDYLPGEIPE